MTTAAGLSDWLLFGHVLAGMVWVGGIVVLAALAVRPLRDPEPGAAGRFIAGLSAVGPIVLAPAPLALAGLGTWMVADDAAWDFDQLWVQLGLGLFAAAFVIGAAHQSRAAIAARRAAERGDEAEASRRLRRWAWGSVLTALLLVIATWDMVAKPGL
jgi:putative copper export protein